MSWSSVSPERFYRPTFYFFLLAIVSFVVYAGMSLATHHVDNPSLLDSDESDYYNLAGNLIHNNYTFDLRRPPIHVLILCILRILAFNNLRATQVLVSLTFSLSGPMMYLLARTNLWSQWLGADHWRRHNILASVFILRRHALQ